MKKLLLLSLLIVSCSTARNESNADVFFLNGGTFDQDVEVIVTPNINEAVKISSYYYDDVNVEYFQSRGTTIPSSNGMPVIMWMPSVDVRDTDDISVANHELEHCTNSIMNWAGVPLDSSTEEVYAYEMGYLSKQFYSHFKK